MDALPGELPYTFVGKIIGEVERFL